MSQQSLASKTITKRNVAQSSVIFSVVVAVVTLGVIGTVAYIDFTENNDSVALEKSIPELIAEQKVRLSENHRQVELISQAEDLVLTMDQRVDDLKRLDAKVKKANDQLNFIATNLQTFPKKKTLEPKHVMNTVKTVQRVAQPVNTKQAVNTLDSSQSQQYINAVFDQNHAANMSASNVFNASGEGYLEFSWLFKARGRMSMEQRAQLQQYLKNQSAWNAKSL